MRPRKCHNRVQRHAARARAALRALVALGLVLVTIAFSVGSLAGTAEAAGSTGPALTLQPTGYPPADLINQIGLGSGLYAATAAQQASIAALSQEAVSNTLADHGLPSSDAAAAQTWGRADAEGELWALVTEAIQAVAAGTATADQANVVAWLTAVEQRQEVQAADNAGLEYAKWAGLGASAYESLLASDPSQSSLDTFLSGTPLAYGAGESLSTPESSSNEGYCVYQSPSPDQSGYTSNIYGSDAPAQCYTPCPSLTGCTVATPTYDQFVQWGEDDTEGPTVDNPSYVAAANSVAEGLGFGAAVAGGSVAGAAVGTALSVFVSGTGLAAALPFAGDAAVAAVADLGAGALTILAGITAASAAGVVTIVIAAITATVIEGINVFSAAALPGQLATLVADAPTTTPNLDNILADPSQASGLYALFIGATLPEPLVESCDNSLLVSSTAVPNPPPCLNAPAIPAYGSGDPVFSVTEKGSTTATTSDTISWADAASKTTANAYVSGDWWVETVTSDTDNSSATFQTLEIHYTNWSGDEEIAWLVGNPTAGYTFVSTLADPSSTITPSTCVADGTCSSSSTLDYVGTDGNDYSAVITGTGVPPVPPTGVTFVSDTSTSVAASPQVAQTGEPVTLTAVISGYIFGGGTVTFSSAVGTTDTTLCTVTSIRSVTVPIGTSVNGISDLAVVGEATCQATFPSSGTQDIFATFSGADYTSSQGELSLDVSTSSATSTSVTASPADPSAGQPVTYVATVSDSYAGGAVPGGTVSFAGGSTECLDLPLTETASGYQASCQVTDYSPGGAKVTASYSGDAATSPSSGSVFIYLPQGEQAISFTAPSTGTFGGTAVLSATGGPSGNPVTFSVDASSGAGVCSLSGTDDDTVSYTGVGNCVIDANQAGNSDYVAATTVTKTIAVGPATPAITWADPAAITYGTTLGTAQLDATSSVAGTFAYTVDGSSVTSGEVLDAGTYTIGTTFTPTDTTDYATASDSVPFTVEPAEQAITWSALPEAGYGQAAFSVSSYASASTGLPLTFSGTGPCSVSTAGVVTVDGSGTCVITASQAGTSDYLPSSAVADLTISPVGLSASSTGVQAYQRVTLSAEVATNVSTSHSTLEIVDQTTGHVVARCRTGTTCSAHVSEPTGMQSYAAEILGPTGAVTATSPPVSVVWSAPAVSLEASTTSPAAAAPVVLTATSSESLTRTSLSLVIYDPSNDKVLASCSRGTTCTLTVAEPGPETFDAAIVAGRGTQVELGSPASVTVNWPQLTVALAPGATSAEVGRPVTLTATANGDVARTGYAILIVETTARSSRPRVVASCARGTSCALKLSERRASSDTFVAEIGYPNGTHVLYTSPPVSVTWN